MDNTKIERPMQTIKPTIAALSGDVKVKIATAIQSVVDKIKERHLS